MIRRHETSEPPIPLIPLSVPDKLSVFRSHYNDITLRGTEARGQAAVKKEITQIRYVEGPFLPRWNVYTSNTTSSSLMERLHSTLTV